MRRLLVALALLVPSLGWCPEPGSPKYPWEKEHGLVSYIIHKNFGYTRKKLSVWDAYKRVLAVRTFYPEDRVIPTIGKMGVESECVNGRKSSKGAVGLLQVLPSTARGYEPHITEQELRWNVTKNVRIASRYERDIGYCSLRYVAGVAGSKKKDVSWYSRRIQKEIKEIEKWTSLNTGV